MSNMMKQGFGFGFGDHHKEEEEEEEEEDEEEDDEGGLKGMMSHQDYLWKRLGLPELSLAAPPNSLLLPGLDQSSSNSPSRKRKKSASSSSSSSDHYPFNIQQQQQQQQQHMINQPNLDLQLKDPLPLDWEQCLDLESGRMYYLNRKTSRKSWDWPKDHHQKLDLELNMSTCSDQQRPNATEKSSVATKDKHSSSSGNMVALACFNCHLLVILSKASPSCPNCKYVHSLPTQPIPPKVPTKSLNTLSLLN